MKGTLFISCFAVFLFLAAEGLTASPPVISVTGVVKQPLNLTMDDLSRFESVSVRLNEVTSDKSYHGAFFYRGVPLKTLLELANVQKEETDFFKQVDMAIVVHSKSGKQTVLSWGEVFYRNPAEIIIAVSANPIMPVKSCKDCHHPEIYERWFNPLKREVGIPKLVVTGDFFTDRSLEDITNIDVVDLHPGMEAKKMSKLFSPGFTITGKVKKRLDIEDISAYPHVEVPAEQMGDGKGYHGLKDFGGVSLEALLVKAGIEPDMGTAFLVSAPDGYRSLLSYGELFLKRAGKNIIIADKVSGEPIKENGRFNLIVPDDLAADRWVKAVEKVEVIQFKRK